MKISDEKLNTYGNKLAEWSNTNHVLIKINNKEINEEGPSPGGFATIIFTPKSQTALKSIIKNSACTENQLDAIINSLPQTKETLAQKLKCLGAVTFKQVKHFED
jgi:hypothetical protein